MSERDFETEHMVTVEKLTYVKDNDVLIRF